MADIMKSCMVIESDPCEGTTGTDNDLLGILDKYVVGGRGQYGVLPELSAQTHEQLAQWDDIGPIYGPGYDHVQTYARLKGLTGRLKKATAADSTANTQEQFEAENGTLATQNFYEEEEESTQQPLPYLTSSQPSIIIPPPPVSSQSTFSLAPSSQLPRSSQRGSRRKRRRVNEGF